MLIIRINNNTIVDMTSDSKLPADYQRILQLPELLKKKSHFLFGPRSTGKTTLIRRQLQDKAFVIDLLKGEFALRLSARPSELEGILLENLHSLPWVVIDEVQKVPLLLDEVHRLIEERGWRFLLTGSSARKLKRGQANMLAGRAWRSELFPLTWREIPEFRLDRYLRYGGLPVVVAGSEPEEELHAYFQTYLREEILAEGLIRQLPPFSRFLQTAALMNGQLINYAQVGSDAEVPAQTIREYFSVLEDTLIGFQLQPWTRSKKRKAIQTAKFYFFDTGVTHTLAGTKTLDRNSNLYGASFEQFIGMELRAYLSYSRSKEEMSYWRTTHGDEVDFLVGEEIAVEVKATVRRSARDGKGLRCLEEEKKFKTLFLVTQDKISLREGRMAALYWEEFLTRLWDGKILK